MNIFIMKGLCQKCHASNVEIILVEGTTVCELCTEKTE